MALSSISQRPRDPARRLSATLDPRVRRALGSEVRRRRLERSMTQADLGAPLTRAFVSAVEAGRTVPSLPALRHMTDRLGVRLSEFFDGVERVASSQT